MNGDGGWVREIKPGRVITTPLPPLSCTGDTAMFVLGVFLFLFCFLLLEDLGCAGKERPELIQPFVSTPNATPLAAQRKFYPLDGTSPPLGIDHGTLSCPRAHGAR